MGVPARLAAGKMQAKRTRGCAEGSARKRHPGDGPGTAVNGERAARVPNTTNISFDRVEAESLLIALDLEGIAVSTGSACSSGTLEPSHVLKAMDSRRTAPRNSLRFSLGLFSTDAEVDRVLDVLPRLVEKLRGLTRKPQAVGSN